jgi:hypothetical protein
MHLIQYLYANGVNDYEKNRYNPPHSEKAMMTASSKEIRDKWHAENKSYNLGYAAAIEQYRKKIMIKQS